MKPRLLWTAVALLAVLAGCDLGPRSPRGFRLPEGDAEKGKAAFLALKCHTCHKVEGVELPAADSPAPFSVVLGGETKRIKTYGELVTSVINPSHILSEKFNRQLADGKLSPMPEFNNVMTVAQMIDLVAFLQPRYRLVEPKQGYYP
jgi:mono/diheme cytochrome c family protein